MNRFADRLWGSDVIAGLYALSAILLFGLGVRTEGIRQVILLGGGAFLSIASLGLFLRSNVIRVALVWLLGFSLALDALFALFLIAALIGWVPVRENADPAKYLKQGVVRWFLTAGTMFYLISPEVRVEYVRKRNDDRTDDNDDEPFVDSESESS